MVTEADGVEYLYCVLVDISRTKKAQEELRLSLERHQIILAQTNDIIFEWDVAGGTVSYSPNWKERFGYAPMTGGVGEAIPKASHIHPEDAPVFLDALRCRWTALITRRWSCASPRRTDAICGAASVPPPSRGRTGAPSR